MIAPLPVLDEHRTRASAAPEAVWDALLATLDGAREARRHRWGARLLGCADTASNGRPLGVAGATTPGFVVSEAEPPARLVLSGRHRFSRYALEFELAPAGGGATELVARTLARFPGLTGRAYRTMLMATGAHVLAVRSLLGAIARRAERGP